MNIYSDQLETVFRKANVFVTHVVLAQFVSDFINSYATDLQHQWFSTKFSHLEEDAFKYFNLGCILKQYECDDLEAIAESHAEAFGEVPEDINEAFATILSTEGRHLSYLRLLNEPSPFQDTALNTVIQNLVYYLGFVESYKSKFLNGANQLDYERLQEDSEELGEFRADWDTLIFYTLCLMDACLKVDQQGLLTQSAISRLIMEIRELALQFADARPIYRRNPSSVIGPGTQDPLPMPFVMFSYSHDSAAHKQWVLEFATELREQAINIILDQWDLKLGQDLEYFTQNIARADKVIVVCTPIYKRKAEMEVDSGVYAEMQIIEREIKAGGKDAKFIPLIKEGTKKTSIPKCLASILGVPCLNEEERTSALEKIANSVFQIPGFY